MGYVSLGAAPVGWFSGRPIAARPVPVFSKVKLVAVVVKSQPRNLALKQFRPVPGAVSVPMSVMAQTFRPVVRTLATLQKKVVQAQGQTLFGKPLIPIRAVEPPIKSFHPGGVAVSDLRVAVTSGVNSDRPGLTDIPVATGQVVSMAEPVTSEPLALVSDPDFAAAEPGASGPAEVSPFVFKPPEIISTGGAGVVSAGFSPWLMVGLVGAALFMFSGKGKRGGRG